MKYKAALFLFFLSTISSLLMIKYKDAPVISNDSYFYMHHANDILEKGLSYYQNAETAPYYWLYSHLIALFKTITPNYFQELAIAWNILAWSLSSILVYRTLNLFITQSYSIIFSSFFCLLPECIQWNAYLLSDTTFLLLYTALVYLSLHTLMDKTKLTFSANVLFSIIIFLFLFSRPVAFVAVVISLAFLLIGKFPSKLQILNCFLLFAIPIGAFITVFTFFKQQPSSETLTNYSANSYSNTFIEWFKEGMIIHDRPELNVESLAENPSLIENALHYPKVIILRFLYFWSPFLPQYSLKHNIVNFITIFPIFITFIIGILQYVRKASKYLCKDNIHISYLIILLFAYSTFHSITLIDYDHRYRYPHIFVAILIAAFIGLGRFLKRKDSVQ